MTMLDQAARALKAEISRQFGAQPLPYGGPDSDDWSATGGLLELEPCVRVVLEAVMKRDEAIVESVDKSVVGKELDTMIAMANKAGYRLNPAQKQTIINALWQFHIRAILDEFRRNPSKPEGEVAARKAAAQQEDEASDDDRYRYFGHANKSDKTMASIDGYPVVFPDGRSVEAGDIPAGATVKVEIDYDAGKAVILSPKPLRRPGGRAITGPARR